MQFREFYREIIGHSPPDLYLWDSWFAKKDGIYHLYHLQAPRKYSQDERHKHARIGLSISRNLHDWNYQGEILTLGKEGEWDSHAQWTGCVFQEGSTYYKFYTGIGSEDLVQRIGLAISQDLKKWEKFDRNPILEASDDYVVFEGRDESNRPHAWRDPYVFRIGEKYYMTISARSKSGPPRQNGVIVLAKSNNLLDWEIKKNVYEPHRWPVMECSQIIPHKGTFHLLFTCDHESHYGLFRCKSNSLTGEYQKVTDKPIVCGNHIYGIRGFEKQGDKVLGFGFINKRNGKFVGKLSTPIEISLD